MGEVDILNSLLPELRVFPVYAVCKGRGLVTCLSTVRFWLEEDIVEGGTLFNP